MAHSRALLQVSSRIGLTSLCQNGLRAQTAVLPLVWTRCNSTRADQNNTQQKFADKLRELTTKDSQASMFPGSGTHHHPKWTDPDFQEVHVTHQPPKDWVDKFALYTIKIMRFNFDVISGYRFFPHTEATWLTRIIFLETVAGVPGSIAGTLRHLASLRRMQRDHGWIRTLLEEAENERMHLLTALQLKQPSRPFRLFVMLTQGIFYNWFFVSYLISPRYCHRMVGYLEEEAVVTYTKCLGELKDGKLPVWSKTEAPEIAKKYWKLDDDAMMIDVIRAIRADEAHHREVNHTLASINPTAPNPFSLEQK